MGFFESVTGAVLEREKSMDPKELSLLTYGKPSGVCQINGQEFPSGRLGNK